jgi:hypothetical protein
MKGRALTWYHWLMDAGQTRGWEEFVVALKTRFAPSAFNDSVGVFTKLRQTSSVKDYQTQFEILSNRIQGMSEEFKVSTFLSGLKEEVRIMVTMMKPTALTTTFGLAKLQEEEVKLRSRGQKYQSWVSNSQGYTKLAAPPNPSRIIAPNQPENRNTTPPYNTNFNRRPSIPIKRLTPAQMQERREKGLCYNCDEKFQSGHRCNRPRLFLLEGVELGESEEIRVEEVLQKEEPECETQEVELLGISLYALAGAPAPRTMRLMGRIKGQPLVILIDTGSTHSFVDQNLAKRIQLPAQERSQLTVMVANGELISRPCCCTAVSFSLQGYDFQTNLHLLVLGGCDMVLGVNWLSTLGPILWDFIELTMKFTHQD